MKATHLKGDNHCPWPSSSLSAMARGCIGFFVFVLLLAASNANTTCKVKCLDGTWKETGLCSAMCKAKPHKCSGKVSSDGYVQCGSGLIVGCSSANCPACKLTCGPKDCGKVPDNCGGYIKCRRCNVDCDVNGGYCSGSTFLCRDNRDCARFGSVCNKC